jgi:Fe-S-cluster-containing dehydrogenase component/DMSO reductase anchor subunit
MTPPRSNSDASGQPRSPKTGAGPWPGLLGELLAEQRAPALATAVSQFASLHDAGGVPAQSKYYRNLIPLSKPGAGEQYAFEVNLDQCSGCKACVAACHALNGLEDDESWRSVGLLIGELPDTQGRMGALAKERRGEWVEGVPIQLHRSPAPQPPGSLASIQRTVTTACHHCADPGCLNGCPVLAYEKDPVTGIVRHLDDQCIGCQYCVMKCPYEVPQYSKRLGIVRKCDMCSQRLAEGEAPACVQSCPNEAIRISVVDVAATIAVGRASLPGKSSATVSGKIPGNSPGREARPTNPFLPASPDPSITLPTTRYVSSILDTATLRAADEASLQPADSHLPLVVMLPLSQLSVGLMVGLAITCSATALKTGVTAAFVLMSVALGIGTLHLGQPLRAWKAFLGWRKSWFSREVIAFGQYQCFLGLFAAVLWLKPDLLGSGIGDQESGIGYLASAIASLLGLAAVFCSVMLYADTRREFWSFGRTAAKFFGSTALLGFAACAVVLDSRFCWGATLVAFFFKLAVDLEILRWLHVPGFPPLKKSALLVTRRFNGMVFIRLGLGLLGGALLPVALHSGQQPLGASTGLIALLLLLAGEGCERFLFFTAVAPDKMPGGVAV